MIIIVTELTAVVNKLYTFSFLNGIGGCPEAELIKDYPSLLIKHIRMILFLATSCRPYATLSLPRTFGYTYPYKHMTLSHIHTHTPVVNFLPRH